MQRSSHPEQAKRGKAEISANLGQKEVSGQLNKVIRALMDQGLIEYTLPDEPNSRLQKYRLTSRRQRKSGVCLRAEATAIQREGGA